MTRKTIKMEITNKQAEQIYDYLLKKSGNEFAGRWFEGSLMDEFAVAVDSQDWQIKMSSGRPILARKYVFAREEYLNSCSSKLVLTLTDNKEKFLSFVKSRFEKSEDLDELDYDDFCCENGLTD